MAGRKDKNTVDYFPHYCIGGKTMFVLESKFGHTGYSVWFKTLELLGSTENHYIDLRDETEVLFLISKLKITEQQFNDIYNLLSKLDAIDSFFWENKIIYSDNFIKNIDDAYKRRNNKCMQKLDLCKHLNLLCTHKTLNTEHNYTDKSKVEYSKVEYSKEKESENYFCEISDEVKDFKIIQKENEQKEAEWKKIKDEYWNSHERLTLIAKNSIHTFGKQITYPQVKEKLKEFGLLLNARGETKESIKELNKHFVNWLNVNLKHNEPEDAWTSYQKINSKLIEKYNNYEPNQLESNKQLTIEQENSES